MDLTKRAYKIIDQFKETIELYGNELIDLNEEKETLEDRISELEEDKDELLSENNKFECDNNELEAEMDSIRMILGDLDCEDLDDVEEFQYHVSDLEEFKREIGKILKIEFDGYNNLWSIFNDVERRLVQCKYYSPLKRR